MEEQLTGAPEPWSEGKKDGLAEDPPRGWVQTSVEVWLQPTGEQKRLLGSPDQSWSVVTKSSRK